MTDQAQTPPETAPAAASPAPSQNGTTGPFPAPEPDTAPQTASGMTRADRLGRDVTLTLRAVEELDVRVNAIQLELALVAALLLLAFAGVAYRARAGHPS